MRAKILKLLDPLYRLLTWYMGAAGLILYGKGGGSPPPAPDYVGAAEQTGASSEKVATQQTYANRPNQYTPFGSSQWTNQAQIDPATGQPVTAWSQETQLDPKLQGSLNSQLALTQGKSDLAGGMMNRVGQDFNKPFDWQNLPGMAQAPQAYAAQGNVQPTGAQTSVNQTGAQTSIPQYGQQLGVSGQQLDTSAPNQTTQSTNAANFSAERDRYTQGAFDRMRPEHQFQEEASRTRLANAGLTPGSESYNRELNRLGESQAGERWNAVNQGGVEQQRMQQMLMGQQQQAFGQDVTGQASQNAAMGQQFGQGLQGGQFTNQALQNMFGQGSAAGQFANQGLQQQFGQGLSAGQFANQGLQQQFGQSMGSAGLYNQGAQQQFGQDQAAWAAQNANRQQAIGEQSQQRNMSLNEMNALLSGQQVNPSAMPGFTGAQMGQGTNYGQAAGQQGQFGLQQFAQQQAQQQAQLQGAGSLAGMGAMAMWSDRRLKSNIVRVGTHPRGVGIYEYDIFGHRERGVMAQELVQVAPELVVRHANGYLMVNYGGL